jgi:hypothetical protein
MHTAIWTQSQSRCYMRTLRLISDTTWKKITGPSVTHKFYFSSERSVIQKYNTSYIFDSKQYFKMYSLFTLPNLSTILTLFKPYWLSDTPTTVRSAHSAFTRMCFAFISEQTATCATYIINWWVFMTEMKSVYFAVRTGSLNKAVCASSLEGWRQYI